MSDIKIDWKGHVKKYQAAMEELNLEVAAEFLLMAASLIQIKLRMLLPVDQEGAEEADDEDPRAGLVQQLLEYQKYKKASIYLRQLESEGRAVLEGIFFQIKAITQGAMIFTIGFH